MKVVCRSSGMVKSDDKKLNNVTNIIVIHAQIECEIDIRALNSHQVLGQIFDQVLTTFLTGFWARF